ncbi:MAG: prolyl oligopeptidase family serine peptidase, partial [Bdellovibrionales bacterium]|nr:prolyl oligopeptidase family serine peptidase [Bdellovibrionales bacterium]
LWKSPIQEESGGAKKWIQLSNFKSSDQIGGIVAFPQGLFTKQAEGSHSSYLFYPEFHPEAAVPLTVPECALSLTQPIGATDTAQFDCETPTSYSTTVRFDLKNLHFSRPKNDVPGAVFLTAVSRDGTLVPYSIYPPKDGTQNPARAILTSYGAYGVESSVTFNRMWSILSEEGFHLVVAHPRGGGYYGRPWREGGRAGNKLNTVSDLIAVAKAIWKHLKPVQLIGHGKSAGAWPFVASLTESSSLFDALLLEMPVLDPLGQLDPADPFLVQEVYEWGEPKNPHIRNMYQKYSPCTGEDLSAIPPMYIRVGSDDERVPPEGVIRWIKSFTTCHKNASIFLEQSDKTGHLGSYNLYDEIASESLRTHFLTHIAETR